MDTILRPNIARQQDSLADKLTDTVWTNPSPLTKAQPESSMGNWICDGLKKHIENQTGQRIDAFLLHYGSIGIDYIAPGPISRKLIYELFPFQDKLILVRLNGQQLKALCDSIAQNQGIPLSGMRFDIKEQKAINITIGNLPINNHLIYALALNDYLTKDRKYQDIFFNCRKVDLKLYLAIAFQQYLSQQKDVEIQNFIGLDNRIQYID